MARKPARAASGEPPKIGRPSEYTTEVADIICGRLAAGESLKKITDCNDMPARPTVYRWIREREEFRNNYVRATEDRADHMFDDMLEIADAGSPEDTQRARLRVDTRKWALSKMIPKKYGEKIETTLKGDEDAPLVIDDRVAARQIAYLLASAVRQDEPR